jgi:osmotically inducible lipoprotein OsmB
MRKHYSSFRTAVLAVALVALTGCASMTTREKNTAIGAAVGGVAGNIIGGGGLLGTAAGAAAGGVIGHQSTKK